MNQSLSARAAPPIWMLALAVSGANVGMSLLSPAVPDLRADLLATADEAQLVLSGFLVMLGLGQNRRVELIAVDSVITLVIDPTPGAPAKMLLRSRRAAPEVAQGGFQMIPM